MFNVCVAEENFKEEL